MNHGTSYCFETTVLQMRHILFAAWVHWPCSRANQNWLQIHDNMPSYSTECHIVFALSPSSQDAYGTAFCPIKLSAIHCRTQLITIPISLQPSCQLSPVRRSLPYDGNGLTMLTADGCLTASSSICWKRTARLGLLCLRIAARRRTISRLPDCLRHVAGLVGVSCTPSHDFPVRRRSSQGFDVAERSAAAWNISSMVRPPNAASSLLSSQDAGYGCSKLGTALEDGPADGGCRRDLGHVRQQPFVQAAHSCGFRVFADSGCLRVSVSPFAAMRAAAGGLTAKPPPDLPHAAGVLFVTQAAAQRVCSAGQQTLRRRHWLPCRS
jgi:hypothetical protein